MAENLSEQEGPSGPEDLYPNDKELMRRLAKGDAEAFEPFVRRHADAVFRAGRFMTADVPTARRVASEAFAEAFRTFYPEDDKPRRKGTDGAGTESGELPPLPGQYGADFGAWMLSIARRRALAEPPLPPPSREIEITGGAADPAGFRKVRELELDLREAIVLRHSRGDDKLGYETIGKVCGIPSGKAAERLAGARHDLARMVGGLSEETPGEPERPEALKALATGTGISLYVILSEHIDGALPEKASAEVERTLRGSERCREEIAALRGADRLAARAVESVRDPEVVGAVMEALGLYSRAVPMGGRRFPRPVLWLVILLAALLAGALVAAGLYTLFGGNERVHRVLTIRVGEDRLAGWRVSEPGRAVSAEVSPGSRVSTGTELDLQAPGPGGTLVRQDGLRLHAEAGLSLRIGEDATDERGFLVQKGRLIVLAPEEAAPFELALPGGVAARFEKPPLTALIETPGPQGSAVVVSVLAGSVTVAREGEELGLRAGERAFARASRPIEVLGPVDLRTFALDLVPAALRPSVWPTRGGSVRRSGASPFSVAAPPVHASVIEGVSGASAVVLAPDGTAYFLAGPPPGKLVAVDGATGQEVAVTQPFACLCTGDPALGPDGRIYVSTRDGAVSALVPGSGAPEPVTVVPPSPGDLLRTGPTIGPDGSVYVVYADGLAAYSAEGVLRWRRKDIAAGPPPSLGPDGAVFAASLDGRLRVLDAATGRDVAGGEISAGEAFLSHVAVGLDGTAYAVSAGGKLVWYAPDGRDGRHGRDSRDEQAPGRRGASGSVTLPESDFPLAPAVARDGQVVVASSTGTVYRLPARPTEPPEKGEPRAWTLPFFQAGESVSQGPIVDGAGRVLLITKSGAFVTVDPTGRSRTVELDARGASPPAVTREGGVIFVTRDGRVFAGPRR